MDPLQAIMSLLQAPKPPQPARVRTTPDGQLDIGAILAGSQLLPEKKSPYERTLRPGETRSAEDLQGMLAEVIMAAGAGASPVTGPRGIGLARVAARVRPGGEAAFNRWFADSIAKDPSGKPLDLYHGTGSSKPISEFISGKGFLTTNRDRANSYAQTARAALTGKGTELDGTVYNVHASIKKPFIVKSEGDIDTMRSPQMIQKLQSEGYDGIVSLPNRWTGEQIYLPFSPTQIKSATGNKGTYSPTSGDIGE